MESQNTDYDYTKREQGNDVYRTQRPSQSMAEQFVSEQLLMNAMVNAAAVRPPIPNIGKIPNRFGYRTDPPGIMDVISIDDSFSANFGDFSGTQGGYGGTSFPSVPQM